jgi:hypothetical protein
VLQIRPPLQLGADVLPHRERAEEGAPWNINPEGRPARIQIRMADAGNSRVTERPTRSET